MKFPTQISETVLTENLHRESSNYSLSGTILMSYFHEILQLKRDLYLNVLVQYIFVKENYSHA